MNELCDVPKIMQSSKVKEILKNIKYDLREWVEWFVSGWPDTRFGKKIRICYWAKKFNLKERPFYIGRSSKIYGDKDKIVFGKNFSCGDHVTIEATKSKGIYIGDDVLMAHGVYLRSANHNFSNLDVPIYKQGHSAETIEYDGKQYSVVIEDDVWVGANVVVLSGAHISKGCVVAAGSIVVNKKYPSYSVIGGVPAKAIKQRGL